MWTLRTAARCLCGAASPLAGGALAGVAYGSCPTMVKCDGSTTGSGGTRSNQVMEGRQPLTKKLFQRKVSQSNVAFSRKKLIRMNPALFSEVYEMEDAVGEGAFSVVRRARHKGTGQYCAVKCLFKDRITSRSDFENEMDLLVELDSLFVVKILEYFEDENEFLLVFELLTGGDLLDQIQEILYEGVGYFRESEVSVILQQMLKAVLCCHSRQIVHRDIKPENFVYQSKSPTAPLKLIDLGLSCYIRHIDDMATWGTPGYMAPEMVRDQKVTEKADVWSIGAILFGLLYGVPLIKNGATYQEADETLTPQYVRSCMKSQEWQPSREARDLLVKMLQHDPQKRIDVYQALQHPFVLQGFKFDDPGKLGVKFDEHCLVSMRRFGSLPALKRLALLVAAHLASHDEECLSARRLFRKLDKRGCGFINVEEMQAAIRREGCPLPQDFADVFRRVDVQHSGGVNFIEFLAAMLEPAFYQREALYSAVFRLLDSPSCDGKLDAQDLACFLSMHGQDITKVLEEVAPNKDFLSHAEFEAMMLNE